MTSPMKTAQQIMVEGSSKKSLLSALTDVAIRGEIGEKNSGAKSVTGVEGVVDVNSAKRRVGPGGG